MKWFRHDSKFGDSDFGELLVEKFGFAGYGRYFLLIETLAKCGVAKSDFKTAKTWSEWIVLLKVKRKSLIKFLDYLESHSQIKINYKTQISCQISCEKLKDIAGYDRLPSYIWVNLRKIIFERDDYTCQYCGDTNTKLECDHIIPVSRGGSDDPQNLTTACYNCNRSKGAMLLEEWMQING